MEINKNSNSANDRVVTAIEGSLPFGADYFIQSNADANGNYQTVTYKRGGAGGAIVRVVTITYDVDGNAVSVSEA